MAHIKMHAAKVALTLEDLAEYGEEIIPIKVEQGLSGQLDEDGVGHFCAEYVFGSFRLGSVDPEKVLSALQILLQTYFGETLMHVVRTDKVELHFTDQTLEFRVEPTSTMRIHGWFFAYYYALIARAKKGLEKLREMNVEMLMVTNDLYTFFNQAHYKFLRILGNVDEMEAYEKAEEYLAEIPAEYRGYQIHYFPLWRPVLLKDQAGFDAKLLELLEAHQRYWGSTPKSDPDRPGDLNGRKNMQLTAIMAYAQDQGLKVNHSSDYTPADLVEGKYVVDLDTRLGFNFKPQ